MFQLQHTFFLNLPFLLGPIMELFFWELFILSFTSARALFSRLYPVHLLISWWQIARENVHYPIKTVAGRWKQAARRVAGMQDVIDALIFLFFIELQTLNCARARREKWNKSMRDRLSWKKTRGRRLAYILIGSSSWSLSMPLFLKSGNNLTYISWHRK